MKKSTEAEITRFLSFLRSGDSEYVSGQSLAESLGLSRSAVWKHARKLRKYGYGIKSVRGLGYMLTSNTDLPVPWELKKLLKTSIIGKEIQYFDVTDSTQEIALSLASQSEESDGVVVIAGQQRSGRGQLKRSWISPTGGLWFSVLVRPKMATATVTALPFAAALAVRDGISVTAGLDARLKWPNDVLIAGKKVAGILLDVSAEAQTINFAVIGVGINANFDASQIRKTIGDSYAVTSLRDEVGHDVSLLNLIRSILERLEFHLNALSKNGPDAIISKWKKYTDMIGHIVRISPNEMAAYEGVATDVQADGALVVTLASGETIRVASGDVQVRY
jgi:BirA family biotin operon repressor/biotin-[acetyl-CoA-carboxylase] ligase